MTSGSVVVIVSVSTPVGRVSQNIPMTVQHIGQDAVLSRTPAQKKQTETGHSHYRCA